MAAINKTAQLITALSSVRSAARSLHVVDTALPQMRSSSGDQEAKGETRPHYQVKKLDEGMVLVVDVPGADEAGTKTWVEEHGALCFRATTAGPRSDRYAGKFLCDADLYLLNEYKSSVRDGVLTMIIPKKSTGA